MRNLVNCSYIERNRKQVNKQLYGKQHQPHDFDFEITQKYNMREQPTTVAAPLLFFPFPALPSSLFLLSSFPLMLLSFANFLPSSDGIIFHHNDEDQNDVIRCFCDKQTCGGALVCAGKFCLIGVRTDENSGHGRLDQHCVDKNILTSTSTTNGCTKDWKQWSEVCICEESLCNTFAFLRSKMDKQQNHYGDGSDHNPLLADHNYDGQAGMANTVQRSLYHPMSHDADLNSNNKDNIITWTGTSINDNDNRGGRDPRMGKDFTRRTQSHHSRGAPLILLLVVLPLVVGAFTVFFVFLNYHCKML